MHVASRNAEKLMVSEGTGYYFNRYRPGIVVSSLPRRILLFTDKVVVIDGSHLPNHPHFESPTYGPPLHLQKRSRTRS